MLRLIPYLRIIRRPTASWYNVIGNNLNSITKKSIRKKLNNKYLQSLILATVGLGKAF